MVLNWNRPEPILYLFTFLLQAIVYVTVLLGIALRKTASAPFRYNVKVQSRLILSQLTMLSVAVVYTFNKIMVFRFGSLNPPLCLGLNKFSAFSFATLTLALFWHLFERNRLTKVGKYFGVLKIAVIVAKIMAFGFVGFLVSNTYFADGDLKGTNCVARRNPANQAAVTLYEIILNTLLLVIFLIPLLEMDRKHNRDRTGTSSFDNAIWRNFFSSALCCVGGIYVHGVSAINTIDVFSANLSPDTKSMISGLVPLGSLAMTFGTLYATWHRWEFGEDLRRTDGGESDAPSKSKEYITSKKSPRNDRSSKRDLQQMDRNSKPDLHQVDRNSKQDLRIQKTTSAVELGTAKKSNLDNYVDEPSKSKSKYGVPKTPLDVKF